MIKGRKLVSGFLVGILVVNLVMNAGATNIKDTKDKAQTLEQQQEQAESEQKSLVTRVREISASMKQMTEQLDQKRAEIEEAEQELVNVRVKERQQHESMKLRIRYMYENGNVNFFELIMESDSVTDFLSKAEYITKMSEYDRKQLEEYQQTILATQAKELELQAEYQQLETLQDSLISQQAEAEKLLAQKNAELDDIASELKEVRAQIVRAEREEQNKQEANKPANNQNSSVQTKPPVVSGSGYFTHPCPGMTYQSSYFGEVRSFDPVPHKGHDYAAAEGTPIYAAAAGTVIIARHSTSAGYWVVIDHGNGLVTKYMHMYTWPFVEEGQKVQKGQHIGGVGSTGYSTGNHLHFQVEKNEVPVNPSLYL